MKKWFVLFIFIFANIATPLKSTNKFKKSTAFLILYKAPTYLYPHRLVGFYVQIPMGSTQSGSSGGPNCSLCAYVNSTNSGGTGEHNDPTSMDITTGNFVIIFTEANKWVSGDTDSVTDSESNSWLACGSTSAANFTQIEIVSGTGLGCNYSFDVTGNANLTMTPQPSQCVSTTCSLGSSYLQFSGVATTASAGLDNWGEQASGTSTSGSNNTNCGTASLGSTNDLIICGVDFNTGSTATAGTSPISFTLRQPATIVAVESAIWSSSGSMTPAMTDNVSSDNYAGIYVGLK